MTNADDLRARHRAELELAVLEDELVEAKASANPAKLRKVKDKVREKREAVRAARGEVDGAAAPAPISVKAKAG